MTIIDSVCKVAEELYENIIIERIEDDYDEEYCNIFATCPDEEDEHVFIASLHNDFSFVTEENIYHDLKRILNKSENMIKKEDPKKILELIIDIACKENYRRNLYYSKRLGIILSMNNKQ